MNIYDGVQFALSTTILGLFAAIIFKIVDAAFRALFVNSIEEGVDRFEKGYMAESERAH
jgi:biopolymer transport protein ExbB/TolQ